MKKNLLEVIVLGIILSLCLSLIVFATGEDQKQTVEELFVYETIGPQGEAPTSCDNVYLSETDKESVRKGGYKAVLLMHTSSDWANAVIAGAKDVFSDLNIKIVAVTDAEMDPNKQRIDIETTLALKPDIIVTLIIDPVSGAVALQQAIDKGIKVVLISNLPSDFKHGKDYAGIVTDDLFQMGKFVAEMIGDTLGGKGKVALMYHDANYYVTNQRDRAVKAVLKRDYPNIEIVTEKGIANPNDGEVVASAIITQYPDIDAIYAPWDTIAEGVVVAARTAGRNDIGVYTIDLGASNAMDMVQDGNMKGIVVDLPYMLGETLAKMGALSVLGKDTPLFVTVPSIKIDKNNIEIQWEKSLNRPIPAEVLKAIKK